MSKPAIKCNFFPQHKARLLSLSEKKKKKKKKKNDDEVKKKKKKKKKRDLRFLYLSLF